jgi:type II secretory pathway component PulM
MIRRATVIAVLLLAACGGPGRVQYDKDHCSVDGVPATLAEVEARQAEVAQRIQARQPWFAVVTLVVLVVAGASNAERLLVLFRSRDRGAHRPFAERIRDALERQRANPWRWFAIVGGTLGLLVIAAGFYIYLDADKRASERALGMLQFCHLALRTNEEQGVLDEQRRNLAAIQSTAGDIRTLVDKLPPAEQRKAQQIIDQMNAALAKQGKIVGEYLQRSDESSKLLKEHTALVQKGLTSLETDLGSLKSLPSNLQSLADSVRRLDAKLATQTTEIKSLQEQLSSNDAKLKQLLARPAYEPPKPPKPATIASKPAPDLGLAKP